MRYLVQLALTLMSAVIVILDWLATGYRGAANLLMMLVPPIVVCWAANEGVDRRAFMALALTAIHLATLSVLGVLIVGY